MDSRITSPYSPAQRRILSLLIGAAVVLAAATSFPFIKQHSSSAAQTSDAAIDPEIADHAAQDAIDENLLSQQRSIIRDAAVIAPLAQAVPTSVILATLTNALPGGISISDLSLSRHDSTVCIVVSAAANSAEQANRFVDTLRSQSLFTNVQLISAGSTDSGSWQAELQMTLQRQADGVALPAAKAPEQSARSADLTPQTNRVQQDIALLDGLLPAQSGLDPLLKQIAQLAAASSLQLSTIKTLPGRELPGCIDQPLEICISGSFNGIYSFLLQLESLPRLKNVSQIQIRDTAEEGGDLQAAFKVDVYSKLTPG